MAWIISRLITTRYHPARNFQMGAYATPDGGFVSVNYRF
jgi:hypothetical protein